MNYENQKIAGIDEAGRGPLFGPVVASAVVFKQEIKIDGLMDSKKISHSKRKEVFNQIIRENIDYGIGIIHEDVIDRINILNATKRAMSLAVKNLKNKPSKLLIDGNQLIESDIKQEAIIKGDQRISQISAASIIAKVTRDEIVKSYSKIYPMFDLDSHKGYGTKKHIESLRKYGPTSIHRHTFKPVCDIVSNSFKEYESYNITKKAIKLIKEGFYIDAFQIKENVSFIRCKVKNLDIYILSLRKEEVDSLLPSIISKIKEKDSVNKARLDVIYSDDNSATPKIQQTCKIS